MFSFKNNYFLIINSIKDLNLKNIKKTEKFSIIYRNKGISENFEYLKKFRNSCKLMRFKFYVANNVKLALSLKADGIYLSANNKSFKPLHLQNLNFSFIGSAHNVRELNFKNIQKCKMILFSKLFLVDYDKKSNFLGIIKFNNIFNRNRKIIPLGGIKLDNLNKIKMVRSNGFALMSDLKKKPAKISRLF